MSNTRRVIALLVMPFLLVVSPPTRGQAQEKGFTSSAEVTLVEVPVHVLGRDGFPVRDLKKEDFEVFDDGDRVELQEVERIDLEDFVSGPKGPQDPPERPLPPAARRYFFMLFDMTFSSPVKMARAREAARHFVLNGMKNGDVAGVGTNDVSKGLKLVLSFTSDRDQLLKALDSLAMPGHTNAMADPLALILDLGQAAGPSGRNAETGQIGDAETADSVSAIAALSRKSFDSYQQGRITSTMKSFQDLARSMNSVRGRKHILYFSEGFDSRLLVGQQAPGSGIIEGDQAINGEIWKIDNDTRFGNTGLQRQFDAMMEFFKQTDCTIYSVDISGLTERAADMRANRPGDTSPQDVEGGRGRGQESLFLLAHGTGGEILKNSNDIASQLEKLQQQTAVTYLLVFAPTKLTKPGAYHSLKVKVRGNARVSSRTGYFEPRPFSKLTTMERRLATAQLIAWGLPRTDIVARVLATPFRQKGKETAEVPVIIEVPGARLLTNHLGDKLTVEFYAYVTDAQTRVRDFLTQNVNLDLTKLRGSLESGGLKFYGTLDLAPGSYWLKVLVRNAETGRTGLQIVPITVPDKDRPEPFVLPPLFHEAPGRWIMVKDTKRKGSEGAYPFVAQGSSYVPAALPAVQRDADTRVSFVLYNVPEGAPVDLEGRIKGSNGKDFGPAKLVRSGNDETGPLGSRRVLCSFRAEGLEKGLYSLLVTGRNRQTGFEGQSAIPIEVQ